MDVDIILSRSSWQRDFGSLPSAFFFAQLKPFYKKGATRCPALDRTPGGESRQRRVTAEKISLFAGIQFCWVFTRPHCSGAGKRGGQVGCGVAGCGEGYWVGLGPRGSLRAGTALRGPACPGQPGRGGRSRKGQIGRGGAVRRRAGTEPLFEAQQCRGGKSRRRFC